MTIFTEPDGPDDEQETVESDVLLTLPGLLEDEFWAKPHTLRTYQLMDYFAAIYTALTALLAAKLLWPALTSARLFQECRHAVVMLLIIIVGGAAVCVATAAVLVWCPQLYAETAHKVMWMGFCACITVMKQPKVQLAIKDALSAKMVQQQPHSAQVAAAADADAVASSNVEWQAAAQALLGPYIILPINIMSTSNWVLRMKWFLPAQIVHTLIIAHGAWSDMPCNAAADARLAQLLQPACEGMVQLQQVALGLLVGPGFVKHSTDSYLACSGIVNSPQTLAWFQQVAYGLFVLCAGFGCLEWRLKARFVQQHKGKRLVYGPWHLVSSSKAPEACEHESPASRLHRMLTYCMAVPVGLAVLWFASMWLVPRIPHDDCGPTCQETGSCVPFKPCDGFLCTHPGFGVSLVVYLLMLLVAHAHCVTMFFM